MNRVPGWLVFISTAVLLTAGRCTASFPASPDWEAALIVRAILERGTAGTGSSPWKPGCPLPLNIAGVVSTLAGPVAGTGALTGDADGAASAARFSSPYALSVLSGRLYVADESNNKIRMVSAGNVTTLAGPLPGSTAGGTQDGAGNAARFSLPRSISTDGQNLFVADTANGRIRKITPGGIVSTLAGVFDSPQGLATDGKYLYISETGRSIISRLDLSTGTTTTLAGASFSSGDADGTGAAARFNLPQGLATDGSYLYVGDAGNHRIRQIDLQTGIVLTLAGPAPATIASGFTDGIGSAARFNWPNGVVTDGRNVFVADSSNHRVRRIEISTRNVITIAGPGGAPAVGDADGTGTAARFSSAMGIATDCTSLFVADLNNKVRQID